MLKIYKLGTLATDVRTCLQKGVAFGKSKADDKRNCFIFQNNTELQLTEQYIYWTAEHKKWETENCMTSVSSLPGFSSFPTAKLAGALRNEDMYGHV